MVWNAMPMYLWRNREFGWWVRYAWIDAGMRSAFVVMRYPNLPGLMFDDYEDVEQSESCGYDDTEITGQKGRGMIVKKGRPALIAAWAS
jgi:hypothetical protein